MENNDPYYKDAFQDGVKSVRKWEKFSEEELTNIQRAMNAIHTFTYDKEWNGLALEIMEERSVRTRNELQLNDIKQENGKMTHPTGEFELLEDCPQHVWELPSGKCVHCGAQNAGLGDSKYRNLPERDLTPAEEEMLLGNNGANE